MTPTNADDDDGRADSSTDSDRVSTSEKRREGSWDPLADHTFGPDDAGNAVVHAFGLLGAGWRRLRATLRRS